MKGQCVGAPILRLRPEVAPWKAAFSGQKGKNAHMAVYLLDSFPFLGVATCFCRGQSGGLLFYAKSRQMAEIAHKQDCFTNFWDLVA